MTDQIPLAQIKDGGAQMRVEMRVETISDYAEDMLDGAVFPPVDVFFDGTDYWLGEGFHRVEATRKIGKETISANVRAGTARDAILFGVSANASHGLRRTQADKRRAVERLLTDPEWAQWSDRKVAEAAKVSHPTVAKIRAELSGKITTSKLSGKITTGLPCPPLDKPSASSGSTLGAVLRTLSDESLIAECRRRGLTVGASNV